MRRALVALAVGATALGLNVAPAQANLVGQQVCRSGSGSSSNDGGVRIYGAGYDEAPDVYYDLAKGQCWTWRSSQEAQRGDVQLRCSGSGRFAVFNQDTDEYGRWYSIADCHRKPQPVANTWTRTVIKVDR